MGSRLHPINEPLTTALFSGLYGVWYPHDRGYRTFTRALLNQVIATVLAMREISEVNPLAQLVQTEDLGKIHSTAALSYQAEFENILSGYAARTGFADREPVLPPTALADMIAGLYGAFAVMVALRRVEVEGGGDRSSTCRCWTRSFRLSRPRRRSTSDRRIRPRTGSRSETTSPRNVFRTRDGRYIGISASIQAMSERLFRAIGREDMIADPRFGRIATASDMPRNAKRRLSPLSRRGRLTEHVRVCGGRGHGGAGL